MYSKVAEDLLIGTAVQESGLAYLVQLYDGPAKGVYQVEPATLYDIYESYLEYRTPLRDKVDQLRSSLPIEQDLISNLCYATAIARLVYYRSPEPLPDKNDVPGMAHMWKVAYNTFKGKGTEVEFIKHYNDYIINFE